VTGQPREDGRACGGEPGSRRPGAAVAVLAAIVVGSTLLRWWGARGVETPWIVPDEVTYAELGRSLYHRLGFEILGQPTSFYSLVYPGLIGGFVSLRDGVLGYDLVKLVQAAAMSLAAVPSYLWARPLAGRRGGLVAAALTVAIPGLAYSGLLMTEVAFYPVVAAASWRISAALARPTLRNQALAVALILLAGATRLQGAVLGPAFVTAALVVAGFERDLRRVLRCWPAIAALAAVGIGWSVWRLSAGGPASDLFGAYRAAGEVHYSVGDVLLYVRWHLADLLVVTGFVPVCAVVVLAAGAALKRERSAEVRALAATALAVGAWFVVEVAVFASRHVGRLAERDLLAVAPLYFVGFAVWLSRGLPRPRVTSAVVAALAVGLVLWLPVGRLATLAAIPDAFMVVPLVRLQAHDPGADLQLAADLAAVVAALLFLLTPRRLGLGLAALLVLAFAATSVSVSRMVAAQSRIVRTIAVGDDRRWIDERVGGGDVTFLYSRDGNWLSVYENLFWNPDVTRVNAFLDARVPALTDPQQPSVGPYEDGRLVLGDGSPLTARYLVAPAALTLVGEELAYQPASALVLWQPRQPVRLSTWQRDVRRADHTLKRTTVAVYDCRRGLLHLELRSPVAQRVVIRRDGARYRVLRLAAGQQWTGDVPTPAGAAGHACTFDVEPERDLDVTRELSRLPAGA